MTQGVADKVKPPHLSPGGEAVGQLLQVSQLVVGRHHLLQLGQVLQVTNTVQVIPRHVQHGQTPLKFREKEEGEDGDCALIMLICL